LKENKRDLMKTISIILAAMICLPILASAVPESVIAGPYNISFDLGLIKDAHKIEIKEPESSETLGGAATKIYTFYIKINNTTAPSSAMISVYVAKQTALPSSRRLSLNIEEVKSLGLLGVHGEARQIDGKDGVVCEGFEMIGGKMERTYFADYYLSNSEKVFIYSGIPWDEGTLQLLKTIHIERNTTG
jgi:hypothetical protein